MNFLAFYLYNMKNTLFLLPFLFSVFATNAQSQSPSVEKSIYGIQVGFLGVWVHNETKLSNSFALRSEFGLDAGFSRVGYFDADGVEGTAYIYTPVITLEPRWYYNLNSRIGKRKSIENNTGNFVGLKISFNPDWFVISNTDGVGIPNQIFIIPKWGIKRSIGSHFTYEAGIGFGYRDILDSNYNEEDDHLALDLHLRIGYTF